jgi:DNA-binding PadR family transcriptional regulator
MPKIFVDLGEGRKRPRGLRNWVLHLLERGPMNGAEMMEQMDLMTRGIWRPSPGSIYPLLEQLLKDRLVSKKPDGRYELTDLARDAPMWMLGLGHHMDGTRDPEGALAEVESYVRFLEDLAGSDRGQLEPLRDRLKLVAERIDRLAGSGGAAR